MRVKDYVRVHMRMAIHVTEVVEEDDLYLVSLYVDRTDQRSDIGSGALRHDMKLGLGKSFIDSLTTDQVKDMLRHEVTQRMFDGLKKSGG